MAEEVCGLPLQADGQKGQRKSYTREEELTGVSFHKECSLEPTVRDCIRITFISIFIRDM